jgi:hypothetical protein
MREKLLADTLTIVTPGQPMPEVSETYREKVAPDEAKRLEGFTLEIVLGRI